VGSLLSVSISRMLAFQYLEGVLDTTHSANAGERCGFGSASVTIQAIEQIRPLATPGGSPYPVNSRRGWSRSIAISQTRGLGSTMPLAFGPSVRVRFGHKDRREPS
jgi:hypothetical protein